MHIHLPRPLHGWRAFVGEVGIIVLGVLIALGAEQVIERQHWLQEVENAREALRADMTELLVNAREREIEDSCIRRRLDYLAGILDSGTGRLPPIGHIGAPAFRSWQPASWSSAISSQIATHFPRAEMLAITSIQVQGASTEQTSAREMDDWAALYSMVGPGRAIGTEETVALRRTIVDAAYRANLFRLQALQIGDAALRSGILSPEDRKTADADLRKLLRGPNYRSLCGPVAAPQAGVDAPYPPRLQADPVRGND